MVGRSGRLETALSLPIRVAFRALTPRRPADPPPASRVSHRRRCWEPSRCRSLRWHRAGPTGQHPVPSRLRRRARRCSYHPLRSSRRYPRCPNPRLPRCCLAPPSRSNSPTDHPSADSSNRCRRELPEPGHARAAAPEDKTKQTPPQRRNLLTSGAARQSRSRASYQHGRAARSLRRNPSCTHAARPSPWASLLLRRGCGRCGCGRCDLAAFTPAVQRPAVHGACRFDQHAAGA